MQNGHVRGNVFLSYWPIAELKPFKLTESPLIQKNIDKVFSRVFTKNQRAKASLSVLRGVFSFWSIDYYIQQPDHYNMVTMM